MEDYERRLCRQRALSEVCDMFASESKRLGKEMAKVPQWSFIKHRKLQREQLLVHRYWVRTLAMMTRW